MKKEPVDVPADIKECLAYDPDTGEMYWKKTLSPRNKEGDVVKGRQVGYKGRQFSTGRVIFTLMGEPLPKGYYVKYHNGDRNDHRWENLGYYQTNYPTVVKYKNGYAVAYGTLIFGVYHDEKNAYEVAKIVAVDRRLK